MKYFKEGVEAYSSNHLVYGLPRICNHVQKRVCIQTFKRIANYSTGVSLLKLDVNILWR